jgi:forkhead transcription factor HCM1
MGSNPFYVYHPTPTPMDKENMYAPQIPAEVAIFSDGMYPTKPAPKRKLADAAPLAPLGERSANINIKKHRTVGKSDPPLQQEPAHIQLPEPEDMPTIEDDGKKPPLSYAMLIGQSILRAPNRRLTLNSIYKWISSSFKFYDSVESGWQNSIRHNLSLNKAFYKQERPKDDPGKGNYWAITPGMEAQFLKELQPKRSSSKPSSFVYQDQSDVVRPSTSSSNLNFPSERSISKIDSCKFPEETELSSDATIPASDPAIHDGIDPEAHVHAMPPPSRNIRSSPPPADIRSSPPPGASEAVGREDTPPPAARATAGSRPSGGRKRNFMAAVGGLGDSGYYSSIESSATRNNARNHFLTSEADHEHPTLKRGRAEEEIARIRSSSFDSPTKTRPDLQRPLNAFPSSSPFRPFEQQALKGPLTPAVIFKKPARPPMSVSPNTNLRNHRDQIRKLLGSPDKSLGLLDSTFSPFPFPPSLELPNQEHFEIYHGEPVNFDVFVDDSPLKSAKRPRLERANTTSGILADITGSGANRLADLGRPDFKVKRLASPVRIGSPLKRSSTDQLPTSHQNMALAQIPEEDDYLFGVELPSDDSETGLDLTQGFQKIGAPASASPALNRSSGMLAPPTNWSRATGSPSKPPSGRGSGRPSLGRSMTSIW